jgi:hypothetical protein
LQNNNISLRYRHIQPLKRWEFLTTFIEKPSA